MTSQPMTKPTFTYVTYIKSTPEQVWDALTNPEFTRQYWDVEMQSDWKVGSPWSAKGSPMSGKILESNPPHRLVYTWMMPDDPTDVSRVSFDIETIGDIADMVCLKVLHDELRADTDMASKISDGWPRVLSSLKTLLETGAPMNSWAGIKRSCAGVSACEEVA